MVKKPERQPMHQRSHRSTISSVVVKTRSNLPWGLGVGVEMLIKRCWNDLECRPASGPTTTFDWFN